MYVCTWYVSEVRTYTYVRTYVGLFGRNISDLTERSVSLREELLYDTNSRAGVRYLVTDGGGGAQLKFFFVSLNFSLSPPIITGDHS